MSVLIKNMKMPKGCIYANDNNQTEYCPLLNHDDVPFCQYIESEPEIAIGIDERPVYCPLSDVPEPCQDTVSRQAAIDALDVLCQEHRYRIPGKRETYSPYNEAWQDALDRAEGAIGNLPSAQPERKTGKWIGYNIEKDGWKRTDGSPVFMRCSECNLIVLNNGSPHWSFCPKCGSYNGGDKDDQL